MLALNEDLLRYTGLFFEFTRHPFVRQMAEWRIFFHVMPATCHGFTNGVARMIYRRRMADYPFCDQLFDWLKAEVMIHEKLPVSLFLALSKKTFQLLGYCAGIGNDLNLPSISRATDAVGICDQNILEALESLDAGQQKLVIESAMREKLDDATVEFFHERDIAQFYFENEGEILRRFEITS
ncbi:MAG: hypothetical protein PHP25_01850 [Candidatus Moranbacteria bacterium]|nr:hypothetical protein [Candidatus Moranbacteria bacterium]